MDPVCMWPKVAVLLLLLLTAMRPRTEAMVITSSGSQTIQKAEGESVNLGCTYTPAAEDKGELDIEWSNVSPDMTQKDKLLLSYAAGQTHNYYPEFKDRLKFSTEPNQGDASVTISALKASDTGTYQCKVKKAPGVDMRKVTLVVLVPPSVPKCWVEGGEEKGATVTLRCKSSKGSIPLTYVWTRETGGAMPATATQDVGGELVIKNHTDSNTGTYVCEAKNSVGQAQCKYNLRAYNPTDNVGKIVGGVIGGLLLLILLLILIWLLIVCRQKKRYQKEAANEIREDVPAPESRPASRQSSRHSSFQSMAGYRTHQGVQYSSVRGHMPSIHESGPIYTGSSNSPSIAGDKAASLKYDERYGFAV
ncbi:PREDICTED: coxsackievirus and adenovirus receptor homolog [Poecilia mexicana]|uniref:Ig-like domain-containing protein n=1 Tax=Poecilia mexicana TaxID=48701 RepID=A0A3B3XP25_9TELE|nr:PREDICTED: coxsackievirus and adenovirus receptor homolog [Poecilia mexicana]XP_014855034.1 PREDICTED: coxsackievirus and adenovirus receptor homolog [Poecilia mexicana]